MSSPGYPSDSVLVKNIMKGDEKAFQLLFNRYYEPLVKFAAHITKSRPDAEEMVQEAFIKVWQNRESIDPELSLKAYLYRITKNLVINFIKRAEHEEKIKKELWRLIQLSRNDTEEGLLRKEYKNSVEKALNTLTPQKQLIYKLSREEGKSHEEIARQLGLSKSTVKNHIVEILKHLRTHLEVHMDVTFTSIFILFSFLD